jgi:hypothetical protein
LSEGLTGIGDLSEGLTGTGDLSEVQTVTEVSTEDWIEDLTGREALKGIDLLIVKTEREVLTGAWIEDWLGVQRELIEAQRG